MNNHVWVPPPSFDMHSDIPVDVTKRQFMGEKNVLSQKHLPRMIKGGLGGSVLIVGGDELSWDITNTGHPLLSTIRILDDILTAIEKEKDKWLLATESISFKEAIQSDKFVVLLGVEGASPIGTDLSVLRSLYRLGIRLIGLTWNEQNDVASGIGKGEKAEGLTKYGERFVKEMNHLGMIIDVSHLAPKGIEDVLSISEHPVLASHSNSRTICNHPRNLTDNQLRKIANKGGLIGVVGFPALVGQNPTIHSLVNHIVHLVDTVGEESVGIGLDFIDYAIDIFQPFLLKSSINYGSDLVYPEGIENVTKVEDLLYVLHQQGFSDRLIEKIAWGNFERLFTTVVNYE